MIPNAFILKRRVWYSYKAPGSTCVMPQTMFLVFSNLDEREHGSSSSTRQVQKSNYGGG